MSRWSKHQPIKADAEGYVKCMACYGTGKRKFCSHYWKRCATVNLPGIDRKTTTMERCANGACGAMRFTKLYVKNDKIYGKRYLVSYRDEGDTTEQPQHEAEEVSNGNPVNLAQLQEIK